MIKKCLSFVLSFTVILSGLLAVTACDFTSGGDESGGTVLPDGSEQIPSGGSEELLQAFTYTQTGESYKITGIKNKSVTQIVVPDCVTEIEKGAFNGCNAVASITLPFTGTSKLTKQGEQIFDENYFAAIFGEYDIKSESNCVPETLKSVTLTQGITEIRYGAFYRCSGLTKITIPNSVTIIGSYAFNGCSGLTEITIPNGVTTIGSYAFYRCSGLTEITIPSSVTEIWEGAFYLCSGLTKITIPNSVTKIGHVAFYLCSGLTEITIPSSVTTIGENVFSGCSGLTNITISNGVTAIGKNEFSGCSGLTEIKIPNSVTTIGEGAFYGCSGLTKITIPNSVTTIGEHAFCGCSGLRRVHFIGSPRDWAWIQIEYGNEELTDATLHFFLY